MADKQQRLITTTEVADLVEKLTGRRPLASSLRAAATDGTMPAPVVSRPGVASLWDADAIEAWLLRRNPDAVRKIQARIARAVDKSESALRREVAAARAAGLTWAQIGAAIPSLRGGHLSKQGAQMRFKDLDAPAAGPVG